MSVTQVSNDNILSMSAAKLTGAMPAIDGSALTGIVAGSEAMTGASDPANETNPADGVGALWINTTTGEMFICVDATTDQNEWNNVGEGSGDVVYTPPLPFGGIGGGTISGYTSGGYFSGYRNIIDKFGFVSNVTATDHGDLTAARCNTAGQSSSSNGYTTGGTTGGMWNTIDKFTFVSSNTTVDHGDLSLSRMGPAGQSSSTHGFSTGGYSGAAVTRIDRFSFTSNVTASHVMDLGGIAYSGAGQSSHTHGYHTSGATGSGYVISTVKFSFASYNALTFVGNLSALGTGYTSGNSSSFYGYTMGGYQQTSNIDKFSFVTDENSTSVGILSLGRYGLAGQSSITDGYTSGGNSGGQVDVVDKFSFSVDGNAVDHGNLSVGREQVTGQQY